MRVAVDGRDLDLTPIEFRLLRVLMEHPDQVLGRPRLLAEVWGVAARVTTRTVDMHVRRLRVKLGEHARRLKTVRGAGYRFHAGAVPAPAGVEAVDSRTVDQS